MRYLGIDFGLKRVGLAISEGSLASPFKVLQVKSFKDAILQVENVVKDGGFDKLVIGLPGGKMGQTVLGFINTFRKKGLEVMEADETLSSLKASQQMIELNIPKKKRQVNDAYSAAIILQNWLDNQ